jgi:CMP-N-acetylneuraminic acid synthetase
VNELVALIPMRHGSERVVGKNWREIGGRPLWEHVLSTLLNVPVIDLVVVDTDSPIVADGVRAAYPQVILLDRPAHLRAGEVPMTDVIAHDATQVPARHYLQTHSTNPLLTASTVADAVTRYLDAVASDKADSLFTVTQLQTRLYDATGAAMNHDPAALLRTQDLPPVYEENSNLYLFSAALAHNRRRIGDRPMMHIMDPLEAVDIDDETDLVLAEALIQHLRGTDV